MIIKKEDHPYYTPHSFPVGGQQFLNCHFQPQFVVLPEIGIRVEDIEGNVWEYKGVSSFSADNNYRIKGWQQVQI